MSIICGLFEFYVAGATAMALCATILFFAKSGYDIFRGRL